MKKFAFGLIASVGMCGAYAELPESVRQPLPAEVTGGQAPSVPEERLMPPTEQVIAADIANRQEQRKDTQALLEQQQKQTQQTLQRVQDFKTQHHVQRAHEGKPQAALPSPEPGAIVAANAPENLYTIDCDGDLYFDMEQGTLVFLDNVRLRNPNMSLDCTQHLQIYADTAKKQAKAGGEKASTESKGEGQADEPQITLPGGGDLHYDSIKMIVASGKVRATYKDKQGQVSSARADKATYNTKTGEIVLHGSPYILTPDAEITNPDAAAFVRVFPDGSMYASRGTKTTFRHVDKKIAQQEQKKKGAGGKPASR